MNLEDKDKEKDKEKDEKPDNKWKILKILEFSSARGMMSVIVENPNTKEIFLYTKQPAAKVINKIKNINLFG